MKSKSTGFILIIVVLLVVAVLVYFFVIKGKSTGTQAQPTGLVSTTTGTAQGLQTPVASTSSTGSQVVEILRNLSVLKLDDAVFRNPAFSLLSDISIALPPVSNQGRRNPFAPIGVEPTPAPASTAPSPTF